MILGYCFDLDGTLLDTETLWVKAIDEFLQAEGQAISSDAAQALVYGHSWHDIHQEITKTYPDVQMPVAEMEQKIAPYYEALSSACDVRIPTSIELLKELADEAPICIVSGSTRATIERAIGTMDIAPLLQFFLGAEDYSPGKPDPACYALAAHRLGLAPESCMVFEDSQAGVQSAKAAGMLCIALARENAPQQDLSGADGQVSDLGGFDPVDWM
ncbi:MAG: HAD family phosphatase [Kiritimatiellae bacterium]|nr:HAD family phosphatase [Kiritimatiellia bacterium]